MKIALTVWEDRISPVFDVANMLLVADVEKGEVKKCRLVEMEHVGISRLVDMLRRMQISVLVCGAISELPATTVSTAGIRLIPFISGKTDHILEFLSEGKPIIPAFAMPGVRRRRRRKGRLSTVVEECLP